MRDYVTSCGVIVEEPHYEHFAWKPADAFTHDDMRYIRISSIGYRQYGWDVMTSVLIHEFGHCDLFADGIAEGPCREANIEIEKAANQRGRDISPPHLVPEDYQRHREFFLRSYVDKDGWTKEKCLAEWEEFQRTL